MADQRPDRPVIEVRGLEQRFGDTLIFEGLDLSVGSGEAIGLIGGAGSGKSILLKSILGLHRPTGGSVRVFGRDPLDLTRRDWRDLQRRWGVVFQSDALFSTLTVMQNVVRVISEHVDLPAKLARRLAEIKLAQAGLGAEAAGKFPTELSGGMRKKAGLARALALDPELLVLDEPTSGLDPIAAQNLRELLCRLQGTLNPTMFLVTHDMGLVRQTCDRVAVLADCTFVAVGPVDDVARSDHPVVQAFLAGQPPGSGDPRPGAANQA
jgi:phospholipid/cholesterol/gamma-HCH transport system ATP-binding protein